MIEKLARRGFLGFILGGAAGAAVTPASVGVKAAAAALGVSAQASASEIREAGLTAMTRPGHEWMLIDALESNHYAKRRPLRDIPPHIGAMRSWSPVYKASVAAKEEAIMRAYLDKLRHDKSLMQRMAEKFFGVSHDNP